VCSQLYVQQKKKAQGSAAQGRGSAHGSKHTVRCSWLHFSCKTHFKFGPVALYIFCFRVAMCLLAKSRGPLAKRPLFFAQVLPRASFSAFKDVCVCVCVCVCVSVCVDGFGCMRWCVWVCAGGRVMANCMWLAELPGLPGEGMMTAHLYFPVIHHPNQCGQHSCDPLTQSVHWQNQTHSGQPALRVFKSKVHV